VFSERSDERHQKVAIRDTKGDYVFTSQPAKQVKIDGRIVTMESQVSRKGEKLFWVARFRAHSIKQDARCGFNSLDRLRNSGSKRGSKV